MSETTCPVSLPEDLVRFFSGISEIQQEFVKSTDWSGIIVIPREWIWEGENPVVGDITPQVDILAARELFRRLLRFLADSKPVRSEDIDRLKQISEEELSRLITVALNRETLPLVPVL